MWTSPWIQRLLWSLSGFALAALFFVLSNAGRTSSDPANASTRPPIPEIVEEVSDLEVTSGECYLGVVLARDAVVVAAEIEGQLQSINVRVGDQVTQNQVLATLDTRTLQHQRDMERASLRTAEAEKKRQDLAVLQAQEEEKRRQRLEGLISSEEIAAARFQRQQAEAQRDAAEASISRVEASLEQLEVTLARSRIKAPFAGTVAQRYLDAGALVSQGTAVLRLISSDGLRTRFAIPPDRSHQVVIGQRILVEIEGLGATFQGTVEHHAPEIDAASQMLFIEATLEPQPGGPPVPSGAMAKVSTLGSGDSRPQSCF